MNISERIVDYLRKHPGEAICEGCFQKALRASRPLSGMLEGLNPNFITRKVDRCDTCGETKETLRTTAWPSKEEAVAKQREMTAEWEKRRGKT
ncbi:MAG TPA: hypothetical protein VGO52_03365 [Hyphomonadaceae bacterium]|jgi:hypothetical protein|nr:hypothetical protein [Hyphomonadaceae bacterium]